MCLITIILLCLIPIFNPRKGHQLLCNIVYDDQRQSEFTTLIHYAYYAYVMILKLHAHA